MTRHAKPTDAELRVAVLDLQSISEVARKLGVTHQAVRERVIRHDSDGRRLEKVWIEVQDGPTGQGGKLP